MIVAKNEFAKMVNRSAAAVSQWIGAGKLHGEALVGTGRYAQINVDVALRQLGMALDLGQQLAQARPILSAERPALAPEPLAVPGDQERLLKARADREELALQVARAKAAELSGRWLVAEEASEEWSQQLAGIVQAVETWLVTGAAADCATLGAGAGPKEFGKVLRDGFRALRQRLADNARCNEVDNEDEEADAEDLEAV